MGSHPHPIHEHESKLKSSQRATCLRLPKKAFSLLLLLWHSALTPNLMGPCSSWPVLPFRSGCCSSLKPQGRHRPQTPFLTFSPNIHWQHLSRHPGRRPWKQHCPQTQLPLQVHVVAEVSCPRGNGAIAHPPISDFALLVYWL